MKKGLSILVLLITIGSVGFARVSDAPTLGVAILQNGSTVKLLYRAGQTNDVKVLIYNEENMLVLTEKFRNVDGFLRPYNFSELPKGNYRFELIDDNGRTVEQIAYTNEKVEKIAKLISIDGNDKRLVLSVPNKHDDVLTITILDEFSNVLYAATERINGDFAKVYNLENFEGRIRFSVVDQNGNHASLER
jgi:hypothetical protein